MTATVKHNVTVGLCAVIAMPGAPEHSELMLAQRLRRRPDALPVHTYYSGSVKKKLARSARDGVQWALFINADGTVTVRDMEEGAQCVMDADRAVIALRGLHSDAWFMQDGPEVDELFDGLYPDDA